MDSNTRSKMSSNAYCRLCGTCNEDLTEIFLENDTSIKTLFKIRIMLCISISKDDEYSHCICSSCIAKVDEYHSFGKKCQEMQFRLFDQSPNSSVVSIWKMEIDDCDVQPNCLENIKVENDDTHEAADGHIVEKELFIDSEIDSIDENNTPSLEDDLSLQSIDEHDPLSSKDDSPPAQKCDPPTGSCIVPDNSANKISYSKLAGFLRSKVKVTSRAAKKTSSPNDIPGNSPKNVEFCGSNVSNDSGNVVKFPSIVEVGSGLSDGYTVEETIDPKAPKRVSSITLFRSNTSKDSSIFKKKILFLKSSKSDSPNRTTRKKDKNSIKCPYCGEDFTRDEFEKEHMVLHTDDEELHKIILDHVSPSPTNKLLDCEECKMSFYRELAYVEHMNQHSDLRPVKCHMCDRHFFGHKRTRSHFRSAHLVSTFKCESCSYMAKTVSDLDKHRRGVHLNERIMCNICGKLLSAFAHNMKKHLETHNETRPYKCEFCEASFKTSASVARHRENIHFPESVMCSACGTVCKSKQKYKKHAYKCKKRLKKIDL